MRFEECLDFACFHRLADGLRDVDREKVAWGQEPVDIGQVDVVGVEKVRFGPLQGGDCCIGCGSRLRRLAAHDQMFAVGLIPHRNHRHAEVACHDARVQLRPRLMRKSVADAERVMRELVELGHGFSSTNIPADNPPVACFAEAGTEAC